MVSSKDWITRLATDSVPSYSVFTKPIEKSPADDREYRWIKLGNGLEAMVIHDPKADKAAASMDIAVGHLSDPVSLFMGIVIAMVEA
jgi:insulysin